MAQEHEAAEHRQVLHAEDLRHRRIGRRHRRQPQDPHHGREDVDAPGGERHAQKDDDGHRAQRIDAREDVFLGHALAQRARGVGADDVEQADQRQRGGGHARGSGPRPSGSWACAPR